MCHTFLTASFGGQVDWHTWGPSCRSHTRLQACTSHGGTTSSTTLQTLVWQTQTGNRPILHNQNHAKFLCIKTWTQTAKCLMSEICRVAETHVETTKNGLAVGYIPWGIPSDIWSERLLNQHVPLQITKALHLKMIRIKWDKKNGRTWPLKAESLSKVDNGMPCRLTGTAGQAVGFMLITRGPFLQLMLGHYPLRADPLSGPPRGWP